MPARRTCIEWHDLFQIEAGVILTVNFMLCWSWSCWDKSACSADLDWKKVFCEQNYKNLHLKFLKGLLKHESLTWKIIFCCFELKLMHICSCCNNLASCSPHVQLQLSTFYVTNVLQTHWSWPQFIKTNTFIEYNASTTLFETVWMLEELQRQSFLFNVLLLYITFHSDSDVENSIWFRLTAIPNRHPR